MTRRGGVATYLCAVDGEEWESAAIKYPENMDPAALGDGDRCPKCGTESCMVIDWEPGWELVASSRKGQSDGQ